MSATDDANIPHCGKILITGGAGFLGRALVRELLLPECPLQPDEIRVFDVREYDGPAEGRVRSIRGDVRDREALEQAARGVTVVFHLAALVDWGTHPRSEVLEVNLGGTENVIAACRAAGARALVFTSSEDAVYSCRPIRDADETLPYPARYPNAYCRSKAEAEHAVLAANGRDLSTVVLRPAGIYGEADPYHLPALVDMARSGPYVRIGNGKARCLHVYVGNVAHAHVLAARALLADPSSAPAGRVYFVTDSEPENFFTFLDRIVLRAGYRIRPANLWLPGGLMYAVGCAAEAVAFCLRPFVRFTPRVSRFAVSYTCNDFTFSGKRAERDFGYIPKYGTEEAVERTAAYLAGTTDRGYRPSS